MFSFGGKKKPEVQRVTLHNYQPSRNPGTAPYSNGSEYHSFLTREINGQFLQGKVTGTGYIAIKACDKDQKIIIYFGELKNLTDPNSYQEHARHEFNSAELRGRNVQQIATKEMEAVEKKLELLLNRGVNKISGNVILMFNEKLPKIMPEHPFKINADSLEVIV